MRWRILYVDDEPDIREVASMALELEPDFEVETASSGKEALAKAAAWQPHAILLDVMMPEMDGPSTLKRLRDDPGTAPIPVVFITARAQQQEVDMLKNAGAVGVIAKPFDPMQLAREVRELVFE
jgi:CheY-like chemotaxis protein